jgi:hypothetical protein
MTQPYSLIRSLHLPFEKDSSATVSLPATAGITTYSSFPTPVSVTGQFPAGHWQVLFLFSAHIDITINNAECALALDFSGVTNIPAGSKPQDRLHVIAKSPISATFSLSRVAIVKQGVTTIELKYAGSAFNVEDVSLEIVPIAEIAYT